MSKLYRLTPTQVEYLTAAVRDGRDETARSVLAALAGGGIGAMFTPPDVEGLPPDRAAAFLEENAKYIQEAMIQAGFEAIEALLPASEAEVETP